MKRLLVACVATAMVAGAATATAGSLITSKNIQDRTIRGRDIALNTIPANRLTPALRRQLAPRITASSQSPAQNGAPGQNGATGPEGPRGPQGPQGAPGLTPSAGNWGIVNRNTIGSPDQTLRSGPFDPPNGSGALNLAVQGHPAFTDSAQKEKAAFGNEVDFVGDTLASITDVGYWVWLSAESAGRGEPNMPTIQFEVYRNGATGYSTLTYNAPESAANRWSSYIDATATPGDPAGTGWSFTGSGNDCTLATPCTFAQAKADNPDSTIISVMVGKGRDYAFQGAVDALRINETLYDFEEHGVVERDATP